MLMMAAINWFEIVKIQSKKIKFKLDSDWQFDCVDGRKMVKIGVIRFKRNQHGSSFTNGCREEVRHIANLFGYDGFD